MIFVLGLTCPSVAMAESPRDPDASRGDRMLGVTLGGGVQRSVQASLDVDGSKRIGSSPIYVHGTLSVGASGPDGTYEQLRAGAEARHCADHLAVCVVGGADIGYQHDDVAGNSIAFDQFDDVSTEAHDALLVPRAGVESGGVDGVRVRLLVEAPLRLRMDTPDTADGRAGAGLRVGLGALYAF